MCLTCRVNLGVLETLVKQENLDFLEKMERK
jgi:hypothetical protein